MAKHSASSTTGGGRVSLIPGEVPAKLVGQQVSPVDLQSWAGLRNRIIIDPFSYQLSQAAAAALKLTPGQVLKVNAAFRNCLDLVSQAESANKRVVPTDDGGQALLVAEFPAKGIEIRNSLMEELKASIGNQAADLLIGSASTRDFRGRLTAPTMFGGFGEVPRRLSLVDRDGQGTFVFEEVLSEDAIVVSSRELRIDDPEVQRRCAHLLETSVPAKGAPR